MLIPIKCFTCNKTLADKHAYFVRECKKLEEAASASENPSDDAPKLKNMDTLVRGKILDDLGLERLCCRRVMLSTVDMMDLI